MNPNQSAAVAAPISDRPPPSLGEWAAQTLMDVILSGDYLPGERLIEDQLCQRLGVSRPPLREALKSLESLGIVERVPRHGTRVIQLTQHDVFELVSLRRTLESMAINLALPDLDTGRLGRCYAALADMDAIAPTGNAAAMARAGFEFHISIVGLAGHYRLEGSYRSLAVQLELCMALNNRARRTVETLADNVERHRSLLRIIEFGDQNAIDTAMEQHKSNTFLLDIIDQLDGATDQSARWLEHLRAATSASEETT